MIFNISSNSKSTLKSDLGKRYLTSGKRIAGDISDKKITLYLEDDFGKHSAFMSNYFYGEFLSENEFKGNFRPATYVIVLLAILFAVSVESIVAAILFKNLSGVLTPIVVIIAEVLYFFVLKRISFENDTLIKDYISKL